MRVILVDDDVRFLEALSALLETMPDVEVVGQATDGVAAIEEAVRLRPDVVLMDLDMPRLDGVAATRLILEKVPGARVVILSGSDVVAHGEPSIAAGAAAYVRKTNTVTELPAVLASLAAG